MKTFARVALVALVLLGVSARSWGADGVEAKAAFDRLKTLEGDWTSEHGPHGASMVIYKVTARGTTLMETMMPGSKLEMITMYHLDGDDLLITHFCAAGNQPRLKLDRKASTIDHLSFRYDSGTNLDPAKDIHIHDARINFLEGGKVASEWDGFQDGKKFETTKFEITRVKK